MHRIDRLRNSDKTRLATDSRPLAEIARSFAKKKSCGHGKKHVPEEKLSEADKEAIGKCKFLGIDLGVRYKVGACAIDASKTVTNLAVKVFLFLIFSRRPFRSLPGNTRRS